MEFYFPKENQTIEADSMEEALKMLKNILIDNNKKV
jgi:hypothetical protein